MDWKKIIFIYIYFFLGAGGALVTIKLIENYMGKISHILERTIKLESIELKNIRDENIVLEDDINKLQNKKLSLESKNQELEELLFERIKQEVEV